MALYILSNQYPETKKVKVNRIDKKKDKTIKYLENKVEELENHICHAKWIAFSNFV